MQVGPANGLHAAWPSGDVTTLVRVPGPGGSEPLTIERDGDGAHRFRAPGYGTSVLSADADRLSCVPEPGAPSWAWQRLLISHNLPFASVLHGYEVLHASAVETGGEAVGFVAASGVGKTSLALACVRAGARFVCDDALALDGAVRAFPGAGVVNVRPSEAERLGLAGEPGEDGELRVAMERVAEPLPLRAVWFLERGPGVEAFAIEPVSDPAPLLAATFNLTVRTPERLLRHLEVCSGVARSARVRRARIPAGMTATETAERLLDAA